MSSEQDNLPEWLWQARKLNRIAPVFAGEVAEVLASRDREIAALRARIAELEEEVGDLRLEIKEHTRHEMELEAENAAQRGEVERLTKAPEPYEDGLGDGILATCVDMDECTFASLSPHLARHWLHSMAQELLYRRDNEAAMQSANAALTARLEATELIAHRSIDTLRFCYGNVKVTICGPMDDCSWEAMRSTIYPRRTRDGELAAPTISELCVAISANWLADGTKPITEE